LSTNLTVGVVMDPIGGINYHKDTTLALLLAAQARGHRLEYMEMADLYLEQGQAKGFCRELKVSANPQAWFSLAEARTRDIGLAFVCVASANDAEALDGYLADHPFPGTVGVDSREGSGIGDTFETYSIARFNLPRLLLAALRTPPVGVMLARGDLAVEVGFERMAEVQEEILWLCEAAHVPVIWATQVLETLTKQGAPSRAEVTDAAMSGRAECVMLNKGPYVVRATQFLSHVLERMASHQSKKTAMLRKLAVSRLT